MHNKPEDREERSIAGEAPSAPAAAGASSALAAAGAECRRWGRTQARAAALLGGLLAAAALPSAAAAHGPIAPVATSYLARVERVPAGLEAKVIDGYLRLWLRAPPSATVVVLDYRGAPYLRFSRSGVYVNERSEMYYLNYLVPLVPPAGLSRNTPPSWRRVSGGHAYGWHDARLAAFADVAPPPGASYVGRWSVPVLVNGRPSAVSGGVWHAPNPSLVWFWPIAVLLACLLAALRLRRRELDARLQRALALTALGALAVGGAGWALHGRPNVGAVQLALLAVSLALIAWALMRVMRSRQGLLLPFLISFAALLLGDQLAPTLLHGFVLIALPAFLARTAAVLCLGGGAGLLLLAVRTFVED